MASKRAAAPTGAYERSRQQVRAFGAGSCAIALLVPLLAGCIGTASPEASPRLGSWATYEGDDGSLLHVAIAALEVRWDALLRSHESLVLKYEFTPSVNEKGTSFKFQEAIDRSEGRIVQQVALCGLAMPASPSGGPVSCHDDRALLFFGATGLPGALGMGPIWMGSSDSAWIVADPASRGTVQQSTDAKDGCDEHRYEVEEGHAERIRMLAWTMASSRMVVCPGDVFPNTFQTSIGHHPILRSDGEEGKVTFHQTDAGPGDGSIEPLRGSAWDRPGGLPLRDLHPQYLFAGPSDHLVLNMEEAHQAAIDGSRLYADVMEEDGVVVSFDHNRDRGSGEVAAGQGEQQTVDVVMEAVRPDGSGVRVALEKSRTQLLDRSIDEVQVTSERETTAFFSRAERGVDMDTVVDAAKLRNGDLELVNVGVRHGLERQPHAWTRFPGDWQQQDYEVYAGFAPRDPPSQNGISYYYAYEAVMAGTTGAWLLLHVEQRALPFAPPG